MVFKTFQDILEHFNSTFNGIRFTGSGFCIPGFADGKAMVRFVGVEYMGYDHYEHLQLSFEIPVKMDELKFFEEKNNFYLGSFSNKLSK